MHSTCRTSQWDMLHKHPTNILRYVWEIHVFKNDPLQFSCINLFLQGGLSCDKFLNSYDRRIPEGLGKPPHESTILKLWSLCVDPLWNVNIPSLQLDVTIAYKGSTPRWLNDGVVITVLRYKSAQIKKHLCG